MYLMFSEVQTFGIGRMYSVIMEDERALVVAHMDVISPKPCTKMCGFFSVSMEPIRFSFV
ncbi:hypothetical protein JOE21_003034 [Desmospora profundinema]|uniref:Uncharacterized protein n=1 Tax=Desmospora profundinema TaxID=1571184 RepID=A0ABU1IQE8_9BACL|nr:hypothetical protein [Desmospora profundinema]